MQRALSAFDSDGGWPLEQLVTWKRIIILDGVCLLPAPQVSPPKTDIENSVVISDYAQMDRILKVLPCCRWGVVLYCYHRRGSHSLMLDPSSFVT